MLGILILYVHCVRIGSLKIKNWEMRIDYSAQRQVNKNKIEGYQICVMSSMHDTGDVGTTL
jgi:hypothetical protein